MEDRVEELAEKIIYHKKKYYDGDPEISDEAYDKLEEELANLAPDHPVLKIVGSPESGKIKHNPPMLSAQKATKAEEVDKWLADNNYGSVSMGHKVDGLSLSLQYQNGNLIQAATRGNGYQGDDVSLAALKIKGIPSKLPENDSVNIRGEVYLKISEFNRVNEQLGDKYSSPRNLATGTLKQKDIQILDDRTLDFKAWQLVDYDEMTIEAHIGILENWGFEVADFEIIENPTKVIIQQKYEEQSKLRDSFDFEIDGIIFKYNDPEARKQAGSTEHHPKWSIAYKFESKGEITTIKEIDWQVGRTGVLTPVARVEPVEIAGAIISNATLHNVSFIEELGVVPGDEVLIKRAGDVIPKVEEVVISHGRNFKLPDVCPSCGSLLERNSVNLVCVSPKCRDKNIQEILYWLRVTDIKGLGPKSIEQLYDNKHIESPADLYSLDKHVLEHELGKNGLKAFEAINETRRLDLATFLAGLGIPEMGSKMGKTLAKKYTTLEELKNATVRDLKDLEGISDLTAGYIVEGLRDNQLIKNLKENGVELYNPLRKKPKSGLAAFFDTGESDFDIETKGSVYVTGKIEGKTKDEVRSLVEDMGYEWKTSVSGNLDILVYGERPGQTKIDKARDIGIEIISWEEFLSKKPKIDD